MLIYDREKQNVRMYPEQPAAITDSVRRTIQWEILQNICYQIQCCALTNLLKQ